MSYFTRTILIAASLVLGACIIEAPTEGGKVQQRAQAQQPITPIQIKNGANLEGKLEIAGAMFAPGRVPPGDEVRAQLVFRVLGAMDKNYMVFVHVENSENKGEKVNIDHWPARGIRPTSQWAKEDDIIRDEFSFSVPANTTAKAVNIYVGMWDPDTGARMKVTNPEVVRTDGENRVLLAQLPVGR